MANVKFEISNFRNSCKLKLQSIQLHLIGVPPLSLIYAIPDHPWVDSVQGAAVRIAMTVGEAGDNIGTRNNITKEARSQGELRDVEYVSRVGKIFADLTIGADIVAAQSLKANRGLSSNGVALFGSGFIVSLDDAMQLDFGRLNGIEKHIRKYRNGKDITDVPRELMVIDLYDLNEHTVRTQYPELYQWLSEHVRPERNQNKDRALREKWWLFGRPRIELRATLKGVDRFIVC